MPWTIRRTSVTPWRWWRRRSASSGLTEGSKMRCSRERTCRTMAESSSCQRAWKGGKSHSSLYIAALHSLLGHRVLAHRLLELHHQLVVSLLHLLHLLHHLVDDLVLG